MRPRRATLSTPLPSRREVLAVLAVGGAAAIAGDALADGPRPPAAPSASAEPPRRHVVVLSPSMGRVVLVFPSPPFGRLQVSVDGSPLPDEALVADDVPGEPSAAPSASAAPPATPGPSASASSDPASSGARRFAFFAAAGKRQLSVSTENGYFANAEANVTLGGSVDVPINPQPPPPLGGVAPTPHIAGGCCGGDHAASEARARDAAPSLAATALAAALLLARRGRDR